MQNVFRFAGQTWTPMVLAGRASTWGSDTAPAYVDGPLATARFNEPMGMALTPDGTTLFVADYGNQAVRKIDIVGGTVSTLRVGTGSGHADITNPRAVRVGKVTGYVYVACNDGFGGYILRLDPVTGAIVDYALPYDAVHGVTGFDLNQAETLIYIQGLWNGFGNWSFGCWRGPIGSPSTYFPFGGGFASIFSAAGGLCYLDDQDKIVSQTRGGYIYSALYGLKTYKGADWTDLADIEGSYGSSRTGWGNVTNSGAMAKFQDPTGIWHVVRYAPQYYLQDVMFTSDVLDIQPAGGPWPDSVTSGYYTFWGPPGYPDGSRQMHPHSLELDQQKGIVYFSDNPMFTGNDVTSWGSDGPNHSHSIWMLVPTIRPSTVEPPLRLMQRQDGEGNDGPRLPAFATSKQDSIRVGPGTYT